MVGSRFCELFSFDLIRADLKGEISVDIIEKKSVEEFFRKYQFDSIILFSAFTNVDAAEKQRSDKSASCWRINVDGTENVSRLCKNFQKKLIFISTDFVFDGTSGPYGETADVGPDFSKVSWYGITKIEAERKIQELLKDFIILRIAYPYRAKFAAKDDIAKRILRLYRARNLYPMFYDQIITPTFIDDIASLVQLLIKKNLNGIFHLASSLTTTQYDFAYELLSVFKEDPKYLQKASVVDFLSEKEKTPRPVDGGLKVDKIETLGFKPTDFEEGIRKIYEQSNGQLI